MYMCVLECVWVCVCGYRIEPYRVMSLLSSRAAAAAAAAIARAHLLFLGRHEHILLLEQLCQAPILMHRHHDIRPAHEVLVDVQLRYRGPLRVLFDSCTKTCPSAPMSHIYHPCCLFLSPPPPPYVTLTVTVTVTLPACLFASALTRPLLTYLPATPHPPTH
jgi:hypothetical protein